MQFERCQHGGVPDECNVCDGEAGRGVYAFVPSAAMRRYYTASGEDIYILSLISGHVADLTGSEMPKLLAFAKAEFEQLAKRMPGYQVPRVSASNIQRFGRVIEQYVAQQYPDSVAYIVPHAGPGIPTGKQVVIKNLQAFKISTSSPKQATKPRASGPGF